MAIQTNGESILRHHKNRNNGSPSSSDGEEDSPPHQSRVLQETTLDNTSALDSARDVMKSLKYPAKKERREITAVSQNVMENVVRADGNGKVGLAEALACAMNDEFDDLDRAWGITSGSEGVEERVASVLKKIAKRSEKACTLKSLATVKGLRTSTGSLMDGADMSMEELCAEREAQIAAKDREIASLKEALQRPVQPHESGPHNVLADLATRLNAPQPGLEDAAAAVAAEIANNVDRSMQGLVAVEASCRQLFQRAQEEQQFQQDRNREFCPPAGSDHQVSGNDGGARSILRGIP